MESRKNVMGVGCYADPATLARVLKRAVEAYAMAPIESWEEFSGAQKLQNLGAQWLRHLISGQKRATDVGREEWMQPGAISGFFLGVGPCGLKLSIFTGSRAAGRRHQTASLDEVLAVRRKRLH
jgi:hypothetical protein